VYFVSSNTHSLVNLLGGYTRAIEPQLAAFLEETNPENLWHHYQRLKAEADPGEMENLLYYTLSRYLRQGTEAAQVQSQAAMQEFHRDRGLLHAKSALPGRGGAGDRA
jgi:hypothetical protein